MTHRTERVSLRILTLVGCLVAAGCHEPEITAVPSDFALFAQFEPGYSDWKPWTLSIASDGSARQEVYLYSEGKESKQTNTFTLTENDLLKIAREVKNARFPDLRKKYSYNVTDNPTLILRVTMDGQTNEVSVYAPSHLQSKSAVRRFLKLWSTVLMECPSPNGE